MKRFILRRVVALAATLFFVSLLVFVVIRVLPGSSGFTQAGGRTGGWAVGVGYNTAGDRA